MERLKQNFSTRQLNINFPLKREYWRSYTLLCIAVNLVYQDTMGMLDTGSYRARLERRSIANDSCDILQSDALIQQQQLCQIFETLLFLGIQPLEIRPFLESIQFGTQTDELF